MPSTLANLASKKLILGSNSPRRQELLRGLGLEFEVRVHPIEESLPPDLPAAYAAAYLSKLKADAFPGPLDGNEILITADTVVIDRGKVLGKPSNELEAFEMLKSLSGTTHTVMTAVTLKDHRNSITLEDETEVTFRFLEEEEIWYYLKQYQPYDKAGSYGIQEWIGMIGIEYIQGSYYNVMGLPVKELYEQLLKF
jgi:septum formation protein